MGKFRVLNLITRLEKGGAPLALVETVRRISPDVFQIDLAAGQTADSARDMTAEIEASGLPVISVSALRRSPHPVRDAVALQHLVRLMRTGRYHLVHTHTSKAGFLGRIAARICRIPAVVHSPHGTVLDGYFSSGMTRFYALLERLAAPLAQRIVCLTAREIEQYLRAHIGVRKQYTYIYNGIDISACEQAPHIRIDTRSALALPADATVCITVGRLVPVKGQADLLHAFRIAVKSHPDLYLLIAGEGELREDLQALALKLGISERVRFLGWRTDIPALLAAADLFVLSSLNEGLGLVIVEAMASRLPVVATRVGGVPEVVVAGKTGLLVPARAPEDLAQAMLRLADAPNVCKAMGNAGYERAVGQFSIDVTARKTEALYRELLGLPG